MAQTTSLDLIHCTEPGCRAGFSLVPARQFPTLCLDHADDASRQQDGWTVANSTN
jgi:hypothetical protein